MLVQEEEVFRNEKDNHERKTETNTSGECSFFSVQQFSFNYLWDHRRINGLKHRVEYSEIPLKERPKKDRGIFTIDELRLMREHTDERF